MGVRFVFNYSFLKFVFVFFLKAFYGMYFPVSITFACVSGIFYSCFYPSCWCLLT